MYRIVDWRVMTVPHANFVTRFYSERKGDLGLYWSVLIKWILKEIECDIVDCIQLIQDSVQWQALVKVAMNLRAREI
jgi:hypothetical protein